MFGDLFGSLFLIGVGLILGWNLLPQPRWVQRIYNWVAGFFKGESDEGSAE